MCRVAGTRLKWFSAQSWWRSRRAESAIGTNRRRSNQQPSGAAERLDPKHLKIRQIYFSEWTDTIFNLDKSNFGQYKKPLSAQIAATASNILAAAARRASFSSGTNNQMMMEEPHLRPWKSGQRD